MSGTAVRNSDSRAPLLGQMGTTITCCGVEATLHVAPEGTITYSPVQVQLPGCCCSTGDAPGRSRY